MYHIDHLMEVLQVMPAIDCAQGTNAWSDLHPPVPKKETERFCKHRIRSNFQAANSDTSGVLPPKASSKKRRISHLDGDGVITAIVSDKIVEIGNYDTNSANIIQVGGIETESDACMPTDEASQVGSPIDDTRATSPLATSAFDDDVDSVEDPPHEAVHSSNNAYGSFSSIASWVSRIMN
jgi:hypothetical protein